MSVSNPVIDHIDPQLKRIFLKDGVTQYHPVTDIYFEVRNLRRTNEGLRRYDIPVTAAGNVPKGGGKYTPRYAIFNHGYKIVPQDVTHSLYVSGEQITDDGQSGPACIDTDILSVGTSVTIHYEPPAAEIVRTDTELIAIQQLSFNGRVTIDVNSLYSGTTGMIGSANYPVNNLADALVIANNRYIDTLYLLSDLTVPAGFDISNKDIDGRILGSCTLTVEDGANTLHTEFYNLVLSGTLSGDSSIHHCILKRLYNISGAIEQCSVSEEVSFTDVVFLTDVRSYDQTPSLMIANQAMVNATRTFGMFRITNKSGISQFNMHCSYAVLWIDDTCTEGSIYLAGTGKIMENNANGADVFYDDLESPDDMTNRIWAHDSAMDICSDLAFIKKIEGGRWRIVNNQMIFYDEDNITEIARFNLLYDENQNPVERVRV